MISDLGTIVVVEDDPNIADLVELYLRREGFRVLQTTDAVGALDVVDRERPRLVVLDLGLPGQMDGFDACRRLRDGGAVPVLILTARDTEIDRVLGLELGADDYITKPFSTRELVARVKAVLRRFERPTSPSVISFEEVIIDAGAMQLKVRGELTTTTATEFRLLDYLARHPGRVFSRDHLLDAVWGDARFVTPRSVDVYVRRIREKIEIDPENPRYLKTVRGAGYRFELPKTE
ncbi:MAG TPA: response regulator transcription factor [Solirubrobacteraceae bacterium]